MNIRLCRYRQGEHSTALGEERSRENRGRYRNGTGPSGGEHLLGAPDGGLHDEVARGNGRGERTGGALDQLQIGGLEADEFRGGFPGAPFALRLKLARDAGFSFRYRSHARIIAHNSEIVSPAR